MASLTGDYECKADDKGRVLFPAALKRQLVTTTPDRFVAKKDIFADCLALFPLEEWEHQNAILRSRINPYNREHNSFLREFYRGTAEVQLDANGRLLLPRRLLDMVGIDREVVFAGMGSRIEIWAKERYHAAQLDPAVFAAMAESIMGAEPINTEED